MKKTYKVKATKRTWIDIEADDTVSQQEIYEMAKEKITKGRPKWEEPSFNIISISINDDKDNNGTTKVISMDSVDPLINKN